jgi:chemotaxis protein methyltransferase CheR
MAETGRYDNISIQRGLDESYKAKYFRNEGRIWTINDKIRGAVKFEQFNLINEFLHYSNFDIIFFRNVMIYFADELKRKTLGKIRDALKPDGVLFIGSSELLGDHSKDFSMKQYKNGIYFNIRGGA